MESDFDSGSIQDSPQPLRKSLLTLKILFFSIQIGLWSGFAVLLFLRMTSSISKSLDPDVGRILWAVGGSVTCFAIISCVVIRRISARMMAVCDDYPSAIARYFPAMLVGLAVCEMSGLLQAIALLFSEAINIPIVLFLVNAILPWSLFPAEGKLRRIWNHHRGS
jgi:hypothetical protein